jgi:hypothetical protein
MAAGAALLEMLDMLLCHALQLQLFFYKKAGYEYEKFCTAGYPAAAAFFTKKAAYEYDKFCTAARIQHCLKC